MAHYIVIPVNPNAQPSYRLGVDGPHGRAWLNVRFLAGRLTKIIAAEHDLDNCQVANGRKFHN